MQLTLFPTYVGSARAATGCIFHAEATIILLSYAAKEGADRPPTNVRRRMTFPRIRPRVAIEAILWLLLLGFISSRMWPQLAAAIGVQSSGARAPEFELTTLDGQQVSLASLRGKVVLVNFWATWCPPCRIEMPGFQRVYETKRDRGFTIVGISTDAIGSRAVADFVRERGITYPIAMATGAVVQEFGGARTLPISFLIDREGRIRNEVKGIFASVTLEQAVDRLLAEAPATSGGER